MLQAASQSWHICKIAPQMPDDMFEWTLSSRVPWGAVHYFFLASQSVQIHALARTNMYFHSPDHHIHPVTTLHSSSLFPPDQEMHPEKGPYPFRE